jgi:hypothetical protein
MFSLGDALLEGAANGMHTGFVALFLDGGQGQFQRSGGDQAMLLGHG